MACRWTMCSGAIQTWPNTKLNGPTSPLAPDGREKGCAFHFSTGPPAEELHDVLVPKAASCSCRDRTSVCRLGSGLIKSTIQERRSDRQRPSSFEPVCHSVLRYGGSLQPVECSFDAPAKLVEALAEAER